MKNNQESIKLPKHILIIDLVIYLFVTLLCVFAIKNVFIYDISLTQNTATTIYNILFFSGLLLFAFALFVEYKFNNLKINKIVLISAISIFFFNFLAVVIIPNTYSLPFNASITFTFNDKFYAILYGAVTAILLIAYFCLLPKHMLSKKTLIICLFILLTAVYIFILGSFILDFDNYKYIISHHFSDSTRPCISFLGNKNSFGNFLFMGIATIPLISELTKKKRYLFLLILPLLILPFTFCKLAIILSVVLLFAYGILKFMSNFKASKYSIKLLISISSFVIFGIVMVIIFMVNSQSGILFNIKTFVNNSLMNMDATFKSRTEIWRCAFLLLQPAQWVFGCGGNLFNICLNKTYRSNPHPLEDGTHLYNAHNGLIESIGEGGIIFLIINIIMYAYLIYLLVKIYKKNKTLTILLAFNLLIFFVHDMFETNLLLSNSPNNVFNMFMTVIPIVAIYNWQYNQEEIKFRKMIVYNANKLKENNNDSLINKLNNKHILLSVKFIKEDK